MSRLQFQLRESSGTVSIVDRPRSLLVTVGSDRVYTFDRSGRLVSFFDAGTFYRRGLDHRLVRKMRGPNRAWAVTTLVGEKRRSTYREILDPIARLVSDLTSDAPRRNAPPADEDARSKARRLLAVAPLWGPDALDLDGKRFREVYSPVAILPPDQYLALVVQLTEGCSHNKCRFCSFYRDVPFRVKRTDELDRHLDAVIEFFRAGITMRRSVFLGDANALVIEPERLAHYLDKVRERLTGTGAPRGFRSRGIYSFVDSFHTGFDRPEDWREFARRGLSGVYLGVESGSDELLRAMDKPASRDLALAAVRVLKRAGLQVGVILMAGLGGEVWAEAHRRATSTLLEQLPLDRRDLVYFSPYQRDDSDTSMGSFLPELEAAGRARQIAAWTRALLRGTPDMRPRTAVYSLEEYIY